MSMGRGEKFRGIPLEEIHRRVFDRDMEAAVDFFRFGFDGHREEIEYDVIYDGLRAKFAFKHKSTLLTFQKIYTYADLDELLLRRNPRQTMYYALKQYGFERILRENRPAPSRHVSAVYFDEARSFSPESYEKIKAKVREATGPLQPIQAPVPTPFAKVLGADVAKGLGGALTKKDKP